ncbi:histidine kinase N-terminal 7TM domain-containing diguanylate cyclase [Paenibacillus nasutitermitis]|uniref:GGDEF domain-containing protein n=1 Tax=Paenibacillus nasutitermitis TaxID=1652958 RepID=A0A917DY01_9BACL|nr:histidine kinase N-terminal 7TM domain-containing protein [Paenibacillus nasutitermitis]GGD82271.1 hypothetical protein GCM10010911_45480 [Paenibacillus nasutitermitis]
MSTVINNYIVVVCVSGVMSVLLCIYAMLVKTTFSGIRTFVWMSLFCAIYTFGFAFELASDSLAEIKFWLTIEYLGMPFIAPCCLILVFHYLDMSRFLTRKILPLFFLIPVITVVTISTNDFHHLFYQSLYLRSDAPTPLVDIVMGKGYILHGCYTFACLFVGGILLIRRLISSSAYRKQILTMLITLYVPMTGAFLYLMGLTPYGMDPVPVLMSFTSGLYIWSILSMGMLTVAPIARENIFDSMRDGVIVLDINDHVVDYNPAAMRMIPVLDASAIGKSIHDISFPLKEGQAANAEKSGNPRTQHLEQDEYEIKWQNGSETSYYQIRSSPVIKRDGKHAGRTIIMIDVTERTLLHNELHLLATTDGLTGIYNRTCFMELCRKALTDGQSKGGTFCLILLDIDHFKSINDTYGHAVGDRAIQHAIALCKPFIRTEDVFGRYGGEEFVIGLPDLSIDEAGSIAEQIRSALASGPLLTPAGPLVITASFGVVEAATAGHSLEALLSLADEALYQAKRTGRNNVQTALA